MDKIIILGCGYLGYNISDYFRDTNSVSVLGLSSFYCSFLKVPFYEVNVFDFSLLEAIDFKDAIVIDCMMLISPNTESNEKEKVLEKVLVQYEGLYQYLLNHKIKKFISFSSGGAIYGNVVGKVSETAPLNPITFYGEAKTKMEKQLQKSGLNYSIIRLGNLYGGLQEPNKTQGIIPIMVYKTLKSETFILWGGEQTIRDYIYMSDFLCGVQSILKSNKADNEIFNISSGIGTKTADLFHIVKRVTEKELEIQKEESESAIQDIVLDITKMEAYFGYQTMISLEEGIALEYKRINDLIESR